MLRRLALLACLIACRDNSVSYHRVEFPGFTLELPTSVTWSGDTSADYREGQTNTTTVDQVVFISWQTGTPTSVEDMPVLVRTMAAVVPGLESATMKPAHAVSYDGQPAAEMDVTSRNVDMTFADITCGARSVLVGIGASHDFAALRSRVLGSYRCHPIAAEDKAIASAAPIGVDDPAALATYWRMSNDPFTLTNGTSILVAVSIPSPTGVDAKTLQQVIPSMFKGFGGGWDNGESFDRVVAGQHRTFQQGTMTIDGEKMAGVLALWTCTGGKTAVFALGLEQDAAAMPAAIDRIAKLRCARRTDPPLQLATAPDDAGSGAAP
jgi:hypothetical protein